MAEPETLDLFGYLNIVRRHKYVVFGCCVAAGIASAVVSSFFLPRLYRGTVSFMTKVAAPSQRFIPDIVDAYMPLLQKEEVVAGVVKQARDQGIVTDISPAQLRTMGHLQEIQGVSVFELRVECGDPRVAAVLANIWGDLFVAETARTAKDAAQKVEQSVMGEIGVAQQKLKRAQDELNQFCALHYVREPQNAFGTIVRTLTLEREKIESLAREIEQIGTRARAVALLREELESFLATNKGYQGSNEKALFDDLLFLEGVQARFAGTFGQTGQTVTVDMPTQHGDLTRSAVFVAAQRMAARFATTIKLIEADRAKLKNELAELQKRLPLDEAKLQELSRAVNDATLELQLANTRLSSIKENSAISSIEPIVVLSRAFVSTSPVAPRTTVNILVASALGLVAGLGIAFLAEYARRLAR